MIPSSPDKAVQLCAVLRHAHDVLLYLREHCYAGTKPKTQHSAATLAAVRSSLNLSYGQCVALSELLCSQHSQILPHRIHSLTISQLCHLVAPLAGHPDLLARWKAALHSAVDALCAHRNIPPINWTHVSETVLEPSIRKPLRLRFLITCLDLSWNVSGVVAVCTSACSLFPVPFSLFPN
jgi:hypothetical protein